MAEEEEINKKLGDKETKTGAVAEDLSDSDLASPYPFPLHPGRF